MVVTCPQLLLSDVRNVVVPSLQYMLQSTSDHDELGKRLFRDPSLLVVGVGPLARLQYTLEQHRNGTASIAMGNLGAAVGPETSSASTAAYFDSPWVGAGSSGNAETTAGRKTRKTRKTKTTRGGAGKNGRDTPTSLSTGDLSLQLEEDQKRLLPPVIVPQVSLRCQVVTVACVVKRVLVLFLSSQRLAPTVVVACTNIVFMRRWIRFVLSNFPYHSPTNTCGALASLWFAVRAALKGAPPDVVPHPASCRIVTITPTILPQFQQLKNCPTGGEMQLLVLTYLSFECDALSPSQFSREPDLSAPADHNEHPTTRHTNRC